MRSFKKIRMKPLQTFGHCEALVVSVMRTIRKVTEIHLVFDSYIDGSRKDSKRLLRCKSKPNELCFISPDTHVPVIMDYF